MNELLLKIAIKNAVNESIAERLKKINDEKEALIKRVNELVAFKKRTYKNIDISSPMSKEEKDLDREIAKIYSEINQLIIKKRQVI